MLHCLVRSITSCAVKGLQTQPLSDAGSNVRWWRGAVDVGNRERVYTIFCLKRQPVIIDQLIKDIRIVNNCSRHPSRIGFTRPLNAGGGAVAGRSSGKRPAVGAAARRRVAEVDLKSTYRMSPFVNLRQAIGNVTSSTLATALRAFNVNLAGTPHSSQARHGASSVLKAPGQAALRAERVIALTAASPAPPSFQPSLRL